MSSSRSIRPSRAASAAPKAARSASLPKQRARYTTLKRSCCSVQACARLAPPDASPHVSSEALKTSAWRALLSSQGAAALGSKSVAACTVLEPSMALALPGRGASAASLPSRAPQCTKLPPRLPEASSHSW